MPAPTLVLGTPCWIDLFSSDTARAKDFYGRLFGWTTMDPGPDYGGYFLFQKDGKVVAGCMANDGSMGGPDTWTLYLHTDDADRTVEAAKAQGAPVYVEPMDVTQNGRMAMVADPGGAAFYLLTPLPQDDSTPPGGPDAPGTIGWHELASSAGEKAAFAFYSGLFGWETMDEMDMGAMGTYRIFGAGGVQLGGMMDKPENVPASAWTFYVNVDGLDAAVDRIAAKGGQVAMGPMEVPGGSWIVQGIDPQGASFALVAAKR